MQYRKGSHTIFNCQYHIVWCTKYRYPIMEGAVAERLRELTRQICQTNDVLIQRGHVSKDHVHILVSAPAHLSVAKLVQYIKGATSRKLLMEFAHLKKRYWGQHLWARGYFAVTVGQATEKQIKEYIENQDMQTNEDDFRISIR